MSDDEFEQWWERAIEAYAHDLARATGRPVDGARERARQQGARMLPDGRRSADTWLMVICDDSDAAVGTLWIGRHPDYDDCAYIYDIAVDESRRGAGLGRAARLAAEVPGPRRGLSRVGPDRVRLQRHRTAAVRVARLPRRGYPDDQTARLSRRSILTAAR